MEGGAGCVRCPRAVLQVHWALSMKNPEHQGEAWKGTLVLNARVPPGAWFGVLPVITTSVWPIQ